MQIQGLCILQRRYTLVFFFSAKSNSPSVLEYRPKYRPRYRRSYRPSIGLGIGLGMGQPAARRTTLNPGGATSNNVVRLRLAFVGLRPRDDAEQSGPLVTRLRCLVSSFNVLGRRPRDNVEQRGPPAARPRWSAAWHLFMRLARQYNTHHGLARQHNTHHQHHLHSAAR